MGTDSGCISLEWMPAKETATAPVDGYVIEMAEGNSKNFVEVAKVDAEKYKFDATGLKDGEKIQFPYQSSKSSRNFRDDLHN